MHENLETQVKVRHKKPFTFENSFHEGVHEIIITETNINYRNIQLIYPAFSGLNNKIGEIRTNELIRQYAYSFVRTHIPDYDVPIYGYVCYRKEIVCQSVISISFLLNTRFNGVTNMYRAMGALSLRPSNGEIYNLENLFLKDSKYIETINSIISKQIIDKKIPLINAFDGITSRSNFFIKPGQIVIYFEIYEYTPYSYGIPQFSIQLEDVADLMVPEIYQKI